MVGVYFSGTGNTKYCVNKFVEYYGGGQSFSIEDAGAAEAICQADEIVLGYPTQFSNIPKIVRDFILDNKALFGGKKVFLLCTMGLFSGDGAGCGARILKKCGAQILGGLHLNMPDSVADVKLLKRPPAKNRELVVKAAGKIERAAAALKRGQPTRDGLNILSHMAGLFCQRLWFYGKTADYAKDLKIDPEACSGCGKCVSLCPMKNLSLSGSKAASQGKCAMCYRCIANCPKKAITLLGKEIVEQVRIEKYVG